MSVVHFLNTPPVKNGIKNIIGSIAFFGGIAVLYQTSKETEKTSDYFLKASIVLCCVASRPGLYLCEKAIHVIASPQTLEKIFGKNTIFEVNPWHPRHLLNVTANVLSSTALLKWIFDRTAGRASSWLVTLGLFNLATGRSTLHLANDLWYAAARAKRA